MDRSRLTRMLGVATAAAILAALATGFVAVWIGALVLFLLTVVVAPSLGPFGFGDDTHGPYSGGDGGAS